MVQVTRQVLIILLNIIYLQSNHYCSSEKNSEFYNYSVVKLCVISLVYCLCLSLFSGLYYKNML